MPLDINLHAKQGLAFNSEATEILYGGAAGGGKSYLMRVQAILWCAEIPGLQVYLFRRLSDDLYKNHMEGAGGFFALLDEWMAEGLVRYNAAKNYLQFWNKSKIWLCHCQHEKDKLKYQGVEIHVLLIDELTHFSDTIYRFLRGRCRLGGLELPKKHEGMFPRIFCGSNPGGVGHNWVRQAFVNIAGPLKITTMSSEEGGMKRQYIPARLKDNPSLDEDYGERLKGLGNPALVKAMLEGNWDIVDGGAFDDLWDPSVHVVPRFAIPKGWRIDRTFDWGSSHPFSVGWWAVSNGEDVLLDNDETINLPKGSLIRIDEWYGAEQIGTNKGMRLSAREIADGIVQRERHLQQEGWILNKPVPGAADGEIFNVKEKESGSIASLMSKRGVDWKRADKRPGSRVNGYQLLRDRMKSALTREGEAIYFMANCRAAIATLPTLTMDPNKPDDVDTKAEDHVYDDCRYRALDQARDYATEIRVNWAQ